MKRVIPSVQPSLRVDYVATIEALARVGLTVEQIRALGFPIDSRDDLTAAWARGRADGVRLIANRLFQDALNGDRAAIRLYLQSVGGPQWSAPLLDTAGGQPLTLAAMREMFAKEIEGE